MFKLRGHLLKKREFKNAVCIDRTKFFFQNKSDLKDKHV